MRSSEIRYFQETRRQHFRIMGTPVDVFAQVRDAQEKEPVPAGNIPESNLEDFRKFEEQQYGQPPVGEDFMIPDDIEDELPFR